MLILLFYLFLLITVGIAIGDEEFMGLGVGDFELSFHEHALLGFLDKGDSEFFKFDFGLGGGPVFIALFL